MQKINRRNFLGKSAFATLALGAASSPYFRIARAGEPGPNDKVRLGVIGCGDQAVVDIKNFFLNPEVDCVAVCDVDDARLARMVSLCDEKLGHKPDTYRDFRKLLERKDVDIILNATPDHWHALVMVAAVQAGKDVYTEKPLAKTIDEGRAMLTAVQKSDRIVQMGSQWRSAPHIIEATELIKSGKLGKVSLTRAWAFLDWLPSIGHVPDSDVPPGVDYDFWLGPAPLRHFNKNRFHFNFRWFWDYAGGLMTDWGVHLLNMVEMGMPPDAPKSVCSCGGKFIFDDDSETPDSQVTVYDFPTYQLIWEHRAGLNNGLNNRPWGIEWHGTEGNIILNDTGWDLVTEPKKGNIPSQRHRASGDPRTPHVRNFLDCVKSRQQPVLNLEIGHRVSTLAHLGNIAYRSGDKIVWDSAEEKIVDNHKADKLVSVKYRKPWHLPYMRRG